MMYHWINRRWIRVCVGSVAIAVAAQVALAQPDDVHGTVDFRGGAKIPEGQIAIYLEDPAGRDGAPQRATETNIKSDGSAKTIDFSFLPLTRATASPTLQIVARLEREDGWLLARGSAKFGTGSPIHITLNTVMY